MTVQGAEADMTWANYLANKHFGTLDGLRFISIVAVVGFHVEPELLFGLFKRGFLGVDLFFVISGFLITTLLLREQQTAGKISLRQFYIRRTLRIFPLYYAILFGLIVLLLLLAAIGKSPSFAPSFWHYLPYNLTFLANWVIQPGLLNTLWSLATEEQFYLVCPLMLKYLPRWLTVVLLTLFLVGNQLVNFGVLDYWIYTEWDAPPTLYILQCTYTPLILGVFLGFALHHPGGYRVFQYLTVGRFGSMVWLATLYALMILCPSDLSGWPRLSIQLVMMLLVAASVRDERHHLSHLLRWGPVVYVGKISYGIYLLHLFSMAVASRLLQKLEWETAGLQTALTLLLSIVAAGISFRYLEQPFLKLRTRFTPPRNG
ncbi:MAG: acyltransferase [Zavarzinella sp.]